MSDEPTKDEDEYEQYAGPLTRFKKAARPIFALWALFGLAAMAIGLCVVAWGIWHDMSHAIAKTDWSWWTWPRVLLALSVPLGIAILVLNRVRAAWRDPGPRNSRVNRNS